MFWRPASPQPTAVSWLSEEVSCLELRKWKAWWPSTATAMCRSSSDQNEPLPILNPRKRPLRRPQRSRKSTCTIPSQDPVYTRRRKRWRPLWGFQKMRSAGPRSVELSSHAETVPCGYGKTCSEPSGAKPNAPARRLKLDRQI